MYIILIMSSKGKGKRRETKNSNKSATSTPRIRLLPSTPTMATPNHNGTSPSYASVAASPPGLSHSATDLRKHVHTSIADFQEKVSNTLDDLFDQMKTLERELNKSIEFQTARIDELSAKVEPLTKENSELKTRVLQLENQVGTHEDLLNKQERFSRRNNLRIVGVTATTGENCIEFVEDVILRKFNIPGVTVERAHRDGRGTEGRSPHILVKLLSYRDKIDILKQSRAILSTEQYFILDDLTKTDLAEKKKWSKKVNKLYLQGTKLRFSAGKWRLNGQPFAFEES